ncbi:hypothetical protein [Wukongibacter sp. M2B1]
MAKKKECITCELKNNKGCEIGNKRGLDKGGCGAWIERRKQIG